MTPLLARRAAPDRAFESFYRRHVGEVYHYALAALTLNQRAALVMREIEGRTYAEIADVLSLSVPAVEALLFRARRGLKVRRKALGLISAVPVPGSLSSFFGGTGVVAAGGLLGGTVFKVVAAVTAGMVAAGAGYETVKAVAGDKPARASDRVPAPMLQRSPFGSAVSGVLPPRAAPAAPAAPTASAAPAAPTASAAPLAAAADQVTPGAECKKYHFRASKLE